jgi:regulatory protein
VELGYLDDRAFAGAWVESRDRARPRGSAALRRELQHKGVPGQAIDEILSERDARAAAHGVTAAGDAITSAAGAPAHHGPGPAGADELAARRLLEGRGSRLRREADPRRQRQKAYALLARHGFPPDVCQEVAAAFATSDPERADEGV